MTRRGRSKSPAVKRGHSSARALAAKHGWGVGQSSSGEFAVPPTPNTWSKLLDGSIPSIITWLCGTISIALAFPCLKRKYLDGADGVEQDYQIGISSGTVVISVCVFWRLSYNLGLGLVLRSQSNTGSITRIVDHVRTQDPKSTSYQLVRALTETEIHGDVLSNSELPSEFVAWVLFRGLVNVVLPNDVLAFSLAVLCFAEISNGVTDTCDWADSICLPLPAAMSIGIAIVLSSLLGKLRAHHVIGQYAWFWGDFFFPMEQQLTFDGIFELFPHPMYTVGYGWAYGAAILSRSYHVAALAMGSHLAQLLFLWLFETPHMDKIYGGKDVNQKKKLMRQESDEVPSLLLLINFDTFRSSDVLLVLVNLFLATTLIFGSFEGGPLDSDTFFIANACCWRVAATAVLGYVLVRQERTKFWTRHYEKIGLSAEEAFDNWKKIYNALSSLQYVSFVLCAMRLYDTPWAVGDELTEHASFYIFGFCFASMLLLVSGWTWYCVWCDLGVYGHFYGDFFLPRPSQLVAAPKYSGIYRFLNNPDAYLGHSWEYALAMFCSSYQLLWVAIACHACHVAFLNLVEKPHLRAVYSNNVREHGSAVSHSIAKSSRRAGDRARQSMRNAKDAVLVTLLSDSARMSIERTISG